MPAALHAAHVRPHVAAGVAVAQHAAERRAVAARTVGHAVDATDTLKRKAAVDLLASAQAHARPAAGSLYSDCMVTAR